MDNPNKIIGRNIKEARTLKELSQRALGDLVGLSFQHISNYERGQIPKEPNDLPKIADALGVSVDKLKNIGPAIPENIPEPASFTEADHRRFIRQEVRDLLEKERLALESLIKSLLSHDLTPRTDTEIPQGEIVKPAPESAAGTGKPEPLFESVELKLVLPDPPGNMNKDELERWENNVETLQRWSETEAARRDYPRGVPGWAVERFCREAVGFYQGGSIKDVSGLLWDYMEEGNKQ